MRRGRGLVLLAGLCVVPLACEGPAASVGARTEAIARGEDLRACDAPMAVALEGPDGRCSGVLVHPHVVLYAGHCGARMRRVRFGERGAWRRTLTPVRCAVHPDYEPRPTGPVWDYAYCLLPEPVDDVPLAPVLASCEARSLRRGQSAWAVGFGDTEASGVSFGDKRAYTGSLAFFVLDEWPRGQRVSVGVEGRPGETAGLCSGDSGGPTFVVGDDGVWRVLAVHSTTSPGGCGSALGGEDAVLWPALPWVEASTGLDVTPCHRIGPVRCDALGRRCTGEAVFEPGPGCAPGPASLRAAPGAGWPGCGLPLRAVGAIGACAGGVPSDGGVPDAADAAGDGAAPPSDASAPGGDAALGGEPEGGLGDGGGSALDAAPTTSEQEAGVPDAAWERGPASEDAAGEAPAGGAMDATQTGCACAAAGRSPRGPAALLLGGLLLLMVRRRRDTS